MNTSNIMLTSPELLEAMDSCFACGGAFPLRITGGSMLPFLRPGRDSVVLLPVSKPPKKGDIALFLRSDGKPVLHRVAELGDRGYMFIGDAQSAAEGPIAPTRILAVVSRAVVDGKTVGPGGLKWEFYRHIWPIMPLRRLAQKLHKAKERIG